jgi:hypothetical protein
LYELKPPACTHIVQYDKLPERSFNLELFRELINFIKSADKTSKLEAIRRLFALDGLLSHHIDKITKRVIFANCLHFEYPHEFHTSQKLTGVDYDVIFVPKGYFKRNEKKFDIFLSRGHIFLESDLKCITSTNPDTIGNRIKEGSEQSARVVLDVTSRIAKKKLIEGLKTGCERNNELKEILLFYNSAFYRLAVTQITSRRIFELIK